MTTPPPPSIVDDIVAVTNGIVAACTPDRVAAVSDADLSAIAARLRVAADLVASHQQRRARAATFRTAMAAFADANDGRAWTDDDVAAWNRWLAQGVIERSQTWTDELDGHEHATHHSVVVQFDATTRATFACTAYGDDDYDSAASAVTVNDVDLTVAFDVDRAVLTTMPWLRLAMGAFRAVVAACIYDGDALFEALVAAPAAAASSTAMPPRKRRRSH
jgi:hypothetical protein